MCQPRIVNLRTLAGKRAHCEFHGWDGQGDSLFRGKRSSEKTIMICMTTSDIFVNQQIAKRDKSESRLGIIEMPDVTDSIDLAATRIDVSEAPEAQNRSLNHVNQNTYFGGGETKKTLMT